MLRGRKTVRKHMVIKPLCLQVALNQLKSGSRIVSLGPQSMVIHRIPMESTGIQRNAFRSGIILKAFFYLKFSMRRSIRLNYFSLKSCQVTGVPQSLPITTICSLSFESIRARKEHLLLSTINWLAIFQLFVESLL